MTTLRYHDGQDVRLGDHIRWGDDASGVVVVMIAEQEAMPGYEAAEWAYLQDGCLILSSTTDLVRYHAQGLACDSSLALHARLNSA